MAEILTYLIVGNWSHLCWGCLYTSYTLHHLSKLPNPKKFKMRIVNHFTVINWSDFLVFLWVFFWRGFGKQCIWNSSHKIGIICFCKVQKTCLWSQLGFMPCECVCVCVCVCVLLVVVGNLFFMAINSLVPFCPALPNSAKPSCFSSRKSDIAVQKYWSRGFPGGAVVENLPANAGDTGSSPGLGRFHMPRSN